MQASRIAELLDPYLGPPEARRLTPDAFDCISTYIDLLQRWNARINLTAIRTEEEIVTRHFGESLFAARHLFPSQDNSEVAPPLSRTLRQGGDFDSPAITDIASEAQEDQEGRGLAALAPESHSRGSSPQPSAYSASSALKGLEVADIGSGAGFPGIPIKLWAPEVSLTLIESNHKKATFLREVTRALTLTDVNIQNTRAESVTDMSFDVVTLRAVERFESVLPTAARLTSPGGRLALLIGQPQLPQAQSILPALAWSTPISIPNSKSRVLVIAARPREAEVPRK